MNLKDEIRVIEGFPEEGISFKDITTLLNKEEAYKYTIDMIAEDLKDKNIDVIAGPEARGFIFGSTVAYALGTRFVPIRKPGKLPAETESFSYDLEYGQDKLEIHKDAIKKGDRVALVDDLLATGGTINAAAKLIEKCGGEVCAMEFVIELKSLEGREKNKDYYINSLVEYER
ncbi:MAG: adenine phosphoribosyltransferase [Finegoldia sp.]|nr:adenine phosphoribosyltransferase [Finegoldia sp.]